MGFFPLKRIRSTTDKTVVSLSISRSLLRLSGKIPALITVPKITFTIRPVAGYLLPFFISLALFFDPSIMHRITVMHLFPLLHSNRPQAGFRQQNGRLKRPDTRVTGVDSCQGLTNFVRGLGHLEISFFRVCFTEGKIQHTCFFSDRRESFAVVKPGKWDFPSRFSERCE